MTRQQSLLFLFIAVLVPISAVLYQRLTAPRQYQPHEPAKMPTEALPVIVVGAGLAGLSAAFEALKAGAPAVRVLDRAAKPGGNSIKASSGINGAPTRFQPGPDTTFFSDTCRSAGERLRAASYAAQRPQREALITALVDHSAAAIDFLVDQGVDLSVVAQLGGHTVARTHRGSGKIPPGPAIISALLEKLRADTRFQLTTDAEVTGLLTSPSSVVIGVQYAHAGASHTLHGPVIFAPGGFAGDPHGLLAAHRPDLAGLPSTNDPRPGAHGLLEAAGARLADMSAVQIHPTGFVDPKDPSAAIKFLAAEMLRGEGAVLLHRGRRFVNEMQTRDHVSRVMMALPPAETTPLRLWDVEILLDASTCAVAAAHVGFYQFKGLMQRKRLGDLDAATRASLRDYARVVRGEAADRFGRTAFGHWTLGVAGEADEDAEVCVGTVTPIVHFTMGGAIINTRAQVLSSDFGEPERPIAGLWAAGEITGGLHGDNRLGGSSLLECVVFGRMAGRGAAESVAPKIGS